MDAIEALMTRRSVRKFRAESLPRETVTKIVAAGQRAATARNDQPWLFVALTDRERLKGLRDLCPNNGPFIAESGACVVIFCDAGNKYYLEDGAAAAQNILNAAHALGLGGCWVAGDKKDYCDSVRQYLNVPGSHRLVAIVPVGIPAAEPPLTPRRPLDEILFWEKR